MQPEPRLLDHQFYEAWERGDVSEEQLGEYATAYQAFMDRVPTYWRRVLDGLDVPEDGTGAAIVAEEREHADLWANWRSEITESGSSAYPATPDTPDTPDSTVSPGSTVSPDAIPSDEPPELADLFEALEGMSPSELGGALHAYETQQPAVAETKKAGLLEHYGFDAGDDLAFFDEHAEGEDEHIAFGEEIRERHADTEAFDRGFERGAERIYHSLDSFAAS